MKTLKSFLCSLAIIVALIPLGMQTLNAQSYPHIHVYWNHPSNCDCSMAGDFYYRIDAAIVNECEEEFYLEWEDFTIVSGTTTEVDFNPDWSCDWWSTEPCYLVTGIIRKLCPDGHGGFTVQCSGKFNELVSCYDLMHQTIPAQIEWDN